MKSDYRATLTEVFKRLMLKTIRLGKKLIVQYILYTVQEMQIMSIRAVSIRNRKMCPVSDNIMKLNHSWIKHACYPN